MLNKQIIIESQQLTIESLQYQLSKAEQQATDAQKEVPLDALVMIANLEQKVSGYKHLMDELRAELDQAKETNAEWQERHTWAIEHNERVIREIENAEQTIAEWQRRCNEAQKEIDDTHDYYQGIVSKLESDVEFFSAISTLLETRLNSLTNKANKA